MTTELRICALAHIRKTLVIPVQGLVNTRVSLFANLLRNGERKSQLMAHIGAWVDIPLKKKLPLRTTRLQYIVTVDLNI